MLAFVFMVAVSVFCSALPAQETAEKGDAIGGENLKSIQPRMESLFIPPISLTNFRIFHLFLTGPNSKRFFRSKTGQDGECLITEGWSAPLFCIAVALVPPLSRASFSRLDKVMMRRGPPMCHKSAGIDFFPPSYYPFARTSNTTINFRSSSMYHDESRRTVDAEVLLCVNGQQRILTGLIVRSDREEGDGNAV
jgi:hypothetical protein